MTWKKPKAGEDTGEKAPPKKPTFEIREAKDGRPYAVISGRVVKGRGRGGANLLIFPGKFEGQFASMTLSGWGQSNFIPVKPDNVDIEDDTLIIDFEWLKIMARGENVEELIEWLNYIPELPKQKGGLAGKGTPKKKSWKK